MPEKKRQHYISQFYLRNFSVSGNQKSICLFNPHKNVFVPNAAVKNQAQENYFYGSDLEFENYLSRKESKAASVIKDIITNNKLPVYDTEEYKALWLYVMLYWGRTKAEAKKFENDLNTFFQLTYKHYLKPEYKDRNLDNHRIVHEEPGAFNLIQTVHLVAGSYDLKPVLLHNKTSAPFVTSDNPLIPYNQFMERRGRCYASTGIATKGLQVFFPLSPNHCLYFYDSMIYDIDNEPCCELTHINDVTSLNLLQILNSEDVIFFNDASSKDYLDILITQSKAFQKGEKKDFIKHIDQTSGEEYLLTVESSHNLALDLTFTHENSSARRLKLEDRLHYPRSVDHEYLLEKITEDLLSQME